MPIRILCLLYDAPAAEKLRAGLAGLDVDVRPLMPWPGWGKGLSAPWERGAREAVNVHNSVFRGLWKRTGGEGDPDVVCSFSGAYAAVRAALLRGERVPVLCMLDSGHAALEANGTALDAQVEPFAAVAREAREGQRVFGYLESDIATPQKGPGKYASTSQFGAELRRLAGEPSGLFLYQDVGGKTGKDHGRARDVFGPAFVRRAIDAWLGTRDTEPPGPVTVPSPTRVPPHVLLARADLEAGVAEIPGKAAHPVIREALAGCVRGGRRIWRDDGANNPSDEIEWCSAGASRWVYLAHFGDLQKARDAALLWHPGIGQALGSGPPIGWRAAVWELCEDARETGAWRDASVRPEPGWLAIEGRAGQDPRKRWNKGHVRMVERVDGETYCGIGGNESNRMRRATHPLANALGWICV